MKRILVHAFVSLALGFVMGATASEAQTTVYLLDGASALAPASAGWQFKTTGTSPGGGPAATAQSLPANGDISNQSWVTCATLCTLQAGSGTPPRIWITPPISSPVTISGTITPTVFCTEQAAQLNAGYRAEILHWSKRTGGVIASLGITANNGSGECPTSAGAATSMPTLTPNDLWSCSTNCHGQTWNVFAAGDRIVLLFYPDDSAGGTLTQNGSRASSIRYNYTSAGPYYAQTSVGFTETIGFSADSNNARSIGSTD